MAPIAFVLHVAEHSGHEVGYAKAALDKKERVSWAWTATQQSPQVRKGLIKTLRLDISAGTVNGDSEGPYAECLQKATKAASKIVPLLAQTWDSSAPSSLSKNISKKLGKYDRMRERPVPGAIDEKGRQWKVEEFCSLYMKNYQGAKKAVRAMLTASVFATELSSTQGVPVVVLGRPPGHHATCEHTINLDSEPAPSPAGILEGCSLNGGCFYPNCWVAAVHALREGTASKLAYIDVDAHKPDGIWREVDRLRGLSKKQRATVLNEEDRCKGVLFASVHINGYPNPGGPWKSVDTVLPEASRKAFEVWLFEELVKGLGKDGETTQAEFLSQFNRWKDELAKKLKSFDPNGIFIGLGFDFHAQEKEVKHDKRPGFGMEKVNYRETISSLPVSAVQKGPVVLTLEGGYTREGVMDGMRGVLEGLDDLAKSRKLLNQALKVPAKTEGKKRPSSSEKSAADQQRSKKRLRISGGKHIQKTIEKTSKRAEEAAMKNKKWLRSVKKRLLDAKMKSKPKKKLNIR